MTTINSSSIAVINATVQQTPLQHADTPTVYTHKLKHGPVNVSHLTISDQIRLAQVRTGFCQEIAACHDIIDPTIDPI